MARSVGIRQLRNEVSSILAQVREGERVTITDRGRPVAQIIPFPVDTVEGRLRDLVARGEATWSGGRPEGRSRPIEIAGPPVADAIVEDRR